MINAVIIDVNLMRLDVEYNLVIKLLHNMPQRSWNDNEISTAKLSNAVTRKFFSVDSELLGQ